MPGLAIIQTFRDGSLVPYLPERRKGGSINHGWIDVRDRPDLVDQIPECNESAGLAGLLRTIAAPGMPIMTGGCYFIRNPNIVENSDLPDRSNAGYLAVMYRDKNRNSDPQNLVNLAFDIARGLRGSDEHFFQYRMEIEPMQTFFGHPGCYELILRAQGRGDTVEQATAAFDASQAALADSIRQLFPQGGASAQSA